MIKHLIPLLFACALQAQTAVVWSDSLVVAATPQAITAPRVALLSDGTPIITWGASSSGSAQIWCSRFEGGAWSPAVGVVQQPGVPSLFGFGGYDVAVSDSQVYVVFEQLQQGVFLAKSVDGGRSFAPATTVQGPLSNGYTTLSSVVVDGTGNPVVSYILDDNLATYEVRRSADGGATFFDPVTANTAAPGGVVCECCTSDLVASGDSIWMVFRNNNQNLRDIWVSRSTNLAASFDQATDVDASDWMLNACPISGPRMARGGDSLLTVWMSRAGGSGRVYISTLHAGTMQAGQQIGFPWLPGAANAQSQADVTAHGDTTGVVFVEKNREILFYYSTHGAENLINQGKRFALAGHVLQYPSLVFQQGVFHLVYVDATADKILYRQGQLTQSTAIQTPDTLAELGVSVFPNPVATQAFWITSEAREISEITLFDALGRKLLSEKNAGKSCKISTGNLPKGCAWLNICLDGQTWISRKIVIW